MKTFNINGKNITVSDKADAEFTKKMGYELNELEIKGGILSAYAGNFMKGEDSPSLEEIMTTHTTKEISDALSKEILEDMKGYI